MKNNLIVGVSLGEGEIVAVLCDEEFNVLDRQSRPVTPKLSKESVAAKVEKTITSFANYHLAYAVGIGIPAVFDNGGKIVRESSFEGLIGANIYQVFARRIDLPIFVMRRNFCTILAEQAFGQAKDHKTAVTAEIGRNIECAFLVNGRVYRGANNAAGRIGETIVDITREKRSGAGNFGSLVSGEGIAALTGKTVYQILKENPESELVNKQILRDLKESLLTGLYNIKLMFDPEILIISGDILENYDLFKGAFLNLGVKVVRSDLNKEAPALGAAIAAYNGATARKRGEK